MVMKTNPLFNSRSRTIRKGEGRVEVMVGLRSERTLALVMVHVMVLGMSAGCLGALDNTVDPRATLEAFPTLIQEGEMVTWTQKSSPVEGIITKYEWDFGDGTTAETVIGYTSHAYLSYGQYTVRITITNDQGGTDDALVTIVVNGAPNSTFPCRPPFERAMQHCWTPLHPTTLRAARSTLLGI